MKFKVTGNNDNIEHYKCLLYCIDTEKYNPYWNKSLEHNSLVKEFKQYHYALENLSIKSEYLIEQLELGKNLFWQNKEFFCFLTLEEQRIESKRLDQEMLNEYESHLQKLHLIQEQYTKKLVVSVPYLVDIRDFLNKKFWCDNDKDLYKSLSKELNIIEKDVLHGFYNHSVQNDLEIDCSGNIISGE